MNIVARNAAIYCRREGQKLVLANKDRLALERSDAMQSGGNPAALAGSEGILVSIVRVRSSDDVTMQRCAAIR